MLINTIINVGSIVINIVASVILVKMGYGLLGIAYGTVISFIINAHLRYYYSSKFYLKTIKDKVLFYKDMLFIYLYFMLSWYLCGMINLNEALMINSLYQIIAFCLMNIPTLPFYHNTL